MWLTFFLVQAQDISVLKSIRNYVRAHLVRTDIQVIGLTLSALSFLAVPVLDDVGFTAGPAADSAAAAWQASIEVVETDNLFAWCQSAATGGATVSDMQVASVADATLTRVAEVPDLVETFKSVCRMTKKWFEYNWCIVSNAFWRAEAVNKVIYNPSTSITT